ncbi:hypothetical protein KM759_gp120 [Lymphocystis disease virus 4]|uniref:Uncharacterized protein n=1 Tax=Lymphocystis disease virus 4 TaxID=2704413 RepID=A0A6B9XM92_9VIRU|nr:hypothetical protein KM759_gp120 [Lymphocystis disease virus 4]QHR78577.1 hypothetical protein [Lymphocystis disease virus 4]
MFIMSKLKYILKLEKQTFTVNSEGGFKKYYLMNDFEFYIYF